MRRFAIVLLGLFVPVLVACGSAKPADLSQVDFSLTATDIAYDIDRIEVVAGQPVRLTLRNDGVLEHDFSITVMPHEGEVVAGEMNDEMDEHEMENMEEEPDIHVAAPPGGGSSIEFTPANPGEYEFFCTVAGHKEAGMLGTLVVKAP